MDRNEVANWNWGNKPEGWTFRFYYFYVREVEFPMWGEGAMNENWGIR